MKRFLPLLGWALLASGALAAEGDVREYEFSCHVTSLEGDVRPISGSVTDVEDKHYVSGPYLKRTVDISDGDEQLSTTLNVQLRHGVSADRTFEAMISTSPAYGAPKWSPILHYKSYDFEWHNFSQTEAVVVLKNWHEKRPAVRSNLTRTAAGICKFEEKGIAA